MYVSFLELDNVYKISEFCKGEESRDKIKKGKKNSFRTWI